MVGGGQLARMTHQAAIDLDVQLLVLAANADEPAIAAGASHLVGAHDDLAALRRAAAAAPVVTFDHELVPPAFLAQLEAEGVVLRPGAAALAHAQDKLWARRRFAELGFPVPRFASVAGPLAAAEFAEQQGWPLVLKARTGGYDGRGVLVLDEPGAIPADIDWGPEDDPRWLAEEYIPLEAELAVLVARRPGGERVTYPVVQTTQTGGICRWLVSPAPLAPGVVEEATRIAGALAEAIGAVGICAVEFFVGPGGRVLVNEIALRPHNSGHATIEGNVTSQFHQHLRAVLDWPLGATDLVAPAVAMVNVIAAGAGLDVAAALPRALEVEGARVHLYGKAPRPERKIGHVTALGSTPDAALSAARQAADILVAGE